MLFRVVPKEEIAALFALLAVNTIVGPIKKATAKDSAGATDRPDGGSVAGSPLYDFAEITDFADLCLDYTTTRHSAKRYFLPYQEVLSTYTIYRETFRKEVRFNVDRPYVFFGLHACDINALNKLDKVLLGNVFPTPYYAAKRKNMFIIGVGCRPQPSCFCRSMGTDTVLHGFDLFLTDIGDSYFAEIHSATAYNFISQIASREPVERDHERFMAVSQEKSTLFESQVDTTDLTKILDMEFQAPVWEEWGAKCLSCGTCANVCPTCYCYGVEETVALDFKSAAKIKKNYSCNLIDFAEVAGGHNFRPASHTRLKYRYYHKHRGFVEAFEESLCVGCGRCGESCLANITVPEVIASVRKKSVRA